LHDPWLKSKSKFKEMKMKSNIKASIEALTILLLVAILTGWTGTLQIRGPEGTEFIFDGRPKTLPTQIEKLLWRVAAS
jgi:hypothetical protein